MCHSCFQTFILHIMYTEALPFNSEAIPPGVNIRLPQVKGHDPPKDCLHLDASSDLGVPRLSVLLTNWLQNKEVLIIPGQVQ